MVFAFQGRYVRRFLLYINPENREKVTLKLSSYANLYLVLIYWGKWGDIMRTYNAFTQVKRTFSDSFG